MLFLGGHSLQAEEHRRDLKLNHFKHVVEEEKACEDCHEEGAEKGKLLPTKETCADCHENTGLVNSDNENDENDDADVEETETTEVDKEECLTCHTGTLADLADIEAKKRVVKMGPRPYKNLEFSHKTHLDKDLKCEACHGDIAHDEGLEIPVGKYMPTPRQCIDCHLEQIEGFQVRNACQSCHTKDTFDQNFKPDQHKAQWPKYHGTVSHLNEGSHGKDCMTCHVQKTCVDCHKTEKPKDHTQFWQARGHGIMASADREKCMTCHKQDTCVACHNETAPRSHIANWSQNHCLGCHLESNSTPEEGCMLCHRTPQHLKN
ncbi:MAG: hypothetical protein HQM11_15390 [SAR324 cluster bacterium]|nr:hypothetical protein [SAR324 cluster bacterium]